MKGWMETPLLCVVMSSLHTDEGVNGGSTVVLEEDLNQLEESSEHTIELIHWVVY